MLTLSQALTAHDFHYAPRCRETTGPRGGKTYDVERWRRNGATKTWKRRPEAFSIPVKHGMYDYTAITDEDADKFHVAGECPIEALRY